MLPNSRFIALKSISIVERTVQNRFTSSKILTNFRPLNLKES